VLNYIWAGLLITSFGFAVVQDVLDEVNNTYRNGIPWTIELGTALPAAPEEAVRFTLPEGDKAHEAWWVRLEDRTELRIPITDALPPLWLRIAEAQPDGDSDQLRSLVIEPPDAAGRILIRLPEVHLVRVRAMTEAGFEMAEFAVTLALGLAGLMALWLGLMNIAEQSGLVLIMVKAVRPVLGRLFPDIPSDHPALGSISLNLAANVLGMGNAATPLGIRAMQQLQEINPHRDTASDSMCMFLALNTSSVQLVPPVTLVALMGVGVGELIFSIILATMVSTVVAILAARAYARRRRDGEAS
jgi:spore maturation protein A